MDDTLPGVGGGSARGQDDDRQTGAHRTDKARDVEAGQAGTDVDVRDEQVEPPCHRANGGCRAAHGLDTIAAILQQMTEQQPLTLIILDQQNARRFGRPGIRSRRTGKSNRGALKIHSVYEFAQVVALAHVK